MATTTNFGFNTPDNTAYVKDGASAMRTLGNNIDARFGNVTTYPNQIVNVVSGVSRPLPYAMQAGTAAITTSGGTGGVTITFVSGRFTQAPIVAASCNTPSFYDPFIMVESVSSTSVALRVRQNQSTAVATVTAYWTAIQMTSAAAAG
jgi:hypothetical protein